MHLPEQLQTTVDGLAVSELGPADVDDYHALVQRNVAHLTRLGDYLDEVAMSLHDVATAFADDRAAPGRFGIRLDGALVGLRLGFEQVESFETYGRFRLALMSDAPISTIG